MSNENRTLKEELDRSKREIGELKAKKEKEIAQLKDRLAAFDSERVKEQGINKNASRQSVQAVKKGI